MIGICGLGYSGSGALIDLLKEFEGIRVYDEIEFDFVYAPDGIEDLYYHLCENPVRYLSGNTAIKRFINLTKNFSRSTSSYMKATNGKFAEITDNFLRSIIQAQWKGSDIYEKINSCELKKTLKYRIGGRIDGCLHKIIGSKGTHLSYSNMYLSVNPEDFISKSRKYLSDIMIAAGIVGGNVVLNQPFPSNNPERYFKYYDNPVAIVIDKDPRDQFILAKRILGVNGSFIPTDNVDSFIAYYEKMHESQCRNVLRLNFEDLVYEYESTVKLVSGTCKLGKHTTPRKFFDPDISINNTQLFKHYPEYKDDVNRIEKRLEKYLYNFEKYGEIKYTGKSF